jgi:DNA processing protein
MKYLNALNKITGIGPQKMSLLMSHFENSQRIWEANRSELKAVGINETLIETILKERDLIDLEKEWALLEKESIRVVGITDKDYPALLREIHNPPFLIYMRGCVRCLSQPMVAIVGSRKCTSYGKQVAHSISRDLVAAGITVVSGLALGIDAIAHRGALDGKGLTIGVLGSSIEKSGITPHTNSLLGEEIIRSEGLLLSEYPLHTPPSPGTFPARNRLMAGMTIGTIVIEAAQESGSLITANHALENNREVFAVPGSIFSPQSFGTNSLIKRGAKIVTGVQDILEEFSLERTTKPFHSPPEASTEEEKNILSLLSTEPLHIDRIIKLSKLETSTALSTLAMMEMQGMVKDIGGSNYIRF